MFQIAHIDIQDDLAHVLRMINKIDMVYIGTALSDSEKTEAHLEIWKITDSGGTALNPLSWLIPK